VKNAGIIDILDNNQQNIVSQPECLA